MENIPPYLTTVSQVLNELKRQGINDEFTINNLGDVCIGEKTYEPTSVLLERTFRFEGQTDPSDEAIIYVIKTNDGKEAYSIDGYGIYTDNQNDKSFVNFMRHLRYNYLDEI